MGDVVPVDGFERLAALTARLASTAKLEEIVDAVLGQILELGFGAVWMAVLDETTGNLITLKEVIDGVDTTHEMPPVFALDMRQPVGHGFRERRMVNVHDPDSLFIMESFDDVVPEGRLALPRVIYDHMRGHPFACGPLLGSRGQPVGALGLSSYRGRDPIPDALFQTGLLRAFMDHLGIAMERALHITRLERINDELVRAQSVMIRDARIKAVGELASAVAHDLNNLSSIALMAISVGMRSPDDAFQTLPRVERATRAIGDLVGRLQRVARADHPEATSGADLHVVVEDILAMVRPILREHSIDVALDLGRAPRVNVDPTTIHQVILNLILNAQDALSENAADQRRIRIRVRDDDGVVRLVVADNGPGIAPVVLSQLFQPFVTTKSAGHVGLGLAAAHASLKHFGGQLEGRNGTNGGAVFEITLPATTALPPPAPAPIVIAPEKRTARILAVDDDQDILCVIRAYLEPLGYQVETTTGSDHAISIIASDPYDLVLCDVGMPKRSGLEVCDILRKSGYRGKLILMTGWDTDAINRDLRAADCDTLLRKPFLGGDLLHAIDSLMLS